MSKTAYEIYGLSAENQGLVEKLGRIPRSDSFARMLIMGKIKAIQRQLDTYPKPSP